MNLCCLIVIYKVICTYYLAVWNDIHCPELLLPQQCTAYTIGIVTIVSIRGNLHEIERNLAQCKLAAPLLHEKFQTLRILIAWVSHIGTTLIVNNSFHREIEYGIKSAISPYQRTEIVPLELANHFYRIENLISMLAKIVLCKPALHACTPLVCLYQTNRYVKSLMQKTSKEIASG